MLESIFLQNAESGVIGAAIIITIIICSIFYFALRRKINTVSKNLTPIILDKHGQLEQEVKNTTSSFQNRLENLSSTIMQLPHTNEVEIIQKQMETLLEDYKMFELNINEKINKHNLEYVEKLDKTRKDLLDISSEHLTQKALDHLSQNSVTKEEFDRLKNRLEKVIGSEIVGERLELLRSIFDSTQLKTLSWQCKLINLLKGGLAPAAEEDSIIANMIPKSSYSEFLKRLKDLGVVETKKITSYYLLPEYEWLYSYTYDLNLLQQRLETVVKKEREYHTYIRDNLHLVEEGLLFERDEYKLDVGLIDIICRDTNGCSVGIELKYPAAKTSVKWQITEYRTKYIEKTGLDNTRFILVAPAIPENLKDLLNTDGIEYKEIKF